MSLKQKFISAVTFVFAIFALTTFAAAQDNGVNSQNSSDKREKREHRKFGENRRGGFEKEMRGEHGEKMMTRGLEKLNLTDAQKAQVRQIVESSRAASQSAFEQLRALRMKKRDGSITAEEQTRLDALKTQLKASAEQTQNSILAILTAEQRAQLEQIKAERKQKMRERREMRENRQSESAPQNNN